MTDITDEQLEEWWDRAVTLAAKDGGGVAWHIYQLRRFAELARQDGYKRGFEMGRRSVREPAGVTFKDASRYRWLRENSYVEVRCNSPREPGWHPSKLDEAIDRARGSDK